MSFSPYGPFFPKIKRKVCDSVDPTEMCNERWISTRDGSFYYDARREGYCSTQLPGPIGLPILLDACPFCKHMLPGPKARRYWESGQKKAEPPHPPDATCYDEGEE